jgi:hypothetical protein
MMPPCGCTSSENPNLVATCESRICVKIDIRDHVVSECSEDSDCRVRATDCCECGADVNAESLVAVGRGGGYEELVCPPSWACPECEPVYPPDVGARCNGGNCILERL